ncbi:MAG TPA: hypothetical protein VJK28_01620 [Nitrospiria bacterium]|nr:hypothetical protein [Nitrospiria bacterium]
MGRPRMPLSMKVGTVALMAVLPGLEGSYDPEPIQDRADAPVITNLKFEPSAAPSGSRVVLRIQVFDRQGREDIVPILYLLREGVELIKTRLYDDGSQDDRIPHDGFYTGLMTVPLTASWGNHWFVVYIFDKAGHRSNLLLYEFLVSGDRQLT